MKKTKLLHVLKPFIIDKLTSEIYEELTSDLHREIEELKEKYYKKIEEVSTSKSLIIGNQLIKDLNNEKK